MQLRDLAISNRVLARKLDELENNRHDKQFMEVFDVIRRLMEPPMTEKRKIGFKGH